MKDDDKEHYRLGSGCAILSRSFCNIKADTDIEEVRSVFMTQIKKIRDFEKECELYAGYFYDNITELTRTVQQIVERSE